jgi:hypothetical protein
MKRRLFPAIVVAVVALLVACERAGEVGDTLTLNHGDPAPEFTLPSADRDRVALADFIGSKPVLLYFSMGPG